MNKKIPHRHNRLIGEFTGKICVFFILTSIRVISGSLELCLAILELGWDQKTVLESTYIWVYYEYTYLWIIGLRVISGSLELCLAILELGCDQKTVLESNYIYIISTFVSWVAQNSLLFQFWLRVILGFIGLFGVRERSKSVLESLHISEKNHFLGFTLSCVFSLDPF